MAALFPTFDDAWHQVSHLKVALRAGVKVRRQHFRGERWFVIEDPFANQFYRVRPAAYHFLIRLSRDRTVDEIWNERLEADGDEAPGQGEVIHLLGQLYQANLLQANLPGDSKRLFERQRDRKQRELRSQLVSILFIRIPLFNPDIFLKRTLPLFRWLMSWFGWVLWFAAGIVASKLIFDNWESFKDNTQTVLSAHNLGWLYVGAALIKICHEFGHSYVCRRYGGQVTVMGVMLLVFTPLPYMDASSSWGFAGRKERIHVAAAGMIVELFVAFLAVIVWANTGEGVVHSIAYNMVFVASIATFLFNINPLLRFDGYYILSDLLDYPNLHQNALAQAKHLVDRYLFGLKTSLPPFDKLSEKLWLTTFFIASAIYKFLLFTGIILFIADKFFVLGFVLAIIGMITWLIVPVVKAVNDLLTGPRLATVRRRAVVVGLGLPVCLIILLGLVPMPNHGRADGVVMAEQYTDIFIEVDGRLAEILVPSGEMVEEGQPLLRLVNAELDLSLVGERLRLKEANVRRKLVEKEELVHVLYLKKWADAVALRVADLENREKLLVVRAPHRGRWIAPNVHELAQVWLPRGLAVGRVVDETDYYFSAVVTQTKSHYLFEKGAIEHLRRPEVRLRGQAGEVIPVSDLQIIPADLERLPSTALGMLGGGDIQVARDPYGQGRKTKEPVFEVRADIDPADKEVVLQHELSGVVRMRLDDEPYLWQWIRKGRQLLQKRYRI
ncbi:MAG: peptidase M50 [Verrucomicrobiae bacterium]|nr:peptidase M50 [Verrucomicrobiae bacterium]